MELPRWDETQIALENGEELNPLEFFINEYEPSENSEQWRKDLKEALEYYASKKHTQSIPDIPAQKNEGHNDTDNG